MISLHIIISFHVGLDSKNPDTYRKAIASAHEIFQHAVCTVHDSSLHNLCM